MDKTKANEDEIGKSRQRMVVISRTLYEMFGGDGDADIDANILHHLSQTLSGMCMLLCVCVCVCICVYVCM